MRGFALGAGYLVLAVLAGSLLALALRGSVPFEYEQVLSRSVLLFAALGLVPLWRLLHLDAQTVGLTGLTPVVLAKSFLVGLLLVAPIVAFYWIVGYRGLVPDEQLQAIRFPTVFAVVLASAWLVALFEETLFRGVLLTAMRRRWTAVYSAIGSSLIYALVHFLSVGGSAVEPTWYAGFVYLAASLGGLAQPAAYWDAFVSLFLLGILLCMVRSRYGLWWCVGLHAAFVFAIRGQSAISDRDPISPYLPIISDYDHFIGHLVSAWLLVLLIATVVLSRPWLRSPTAPRVDATEKGPRI